MAKSQNNHGKVEQHGVKSESKKATEQAIITTSLPGHKSLQTIKSTPSLIRENSSKSK